MFARKSVLWMGPLLASLLVVGCQKEYQVEYEPAPGPGGRTDVDRPPAAAVDDAAITTKVKAALLASPDVGALKLDVDTNMSNVTLKGEVDTLAQKAEAERIAKGVAGVLTVDNKLVVEAESAS